MATEKTDVVIVGVGGAGGILAAELSKAGMRVIGLERGPRLKTQDFEPHDELIHDRQIDSLHSQVGIVAEQLQPAQSCPQFLFGDLIRVAIGSGVIGLFDDITWFHHIRLRRAALCSTMFVC